MSLKKSNPNINEDEIKAIEEQEEIAVASTEKIQLANQLLAHQFNIDDSFYMTEAKDKGNSLTLGFSNFDYDVKIKIKDVYEMGLIPPEN